MLDLKALHENTRIDHKSHPFQLFQNRCSDMKAEECILYLHWHEHFELIIMRKGSALFHIDSKPYVVRAGEVIIIPGGTLHVGYALDEGMCIMIPLWSTVHCSMISLMILCMSNMSRRIWKEE